MIPYEKMDERLQLLGKDRAWLATRTPYQANTIRQALSPKGGARSQRIQEVLSRAIEDEELRLREAAKGAERPGIYEIFLNSEQLDRADRASRLAQASSLTAFCRSVILAKADEILRREKSAEVASKPVKANGALKMEG